MPTLTLPPATAQVSRPSRAHLLVVFLLLLTLCPPLGARCQLGNQGQRLGGHFELLCCGFVYLLGQVLDLQYGTTV